jgi:hypothetical protein
MYRPPHIPRYINREEGNVMRSIDGRLLTKEEQQAIQKAHEKAINFEYDTSLYTIIEKET